MATGPVLRGSVARWTESSGLIEILADKRRIETFRIRAFFLIIEVVKDVASDRCRRKTRAAAAQIQIR